VRRQDFKKQMLKKSLAWFLGGYRLCDSGCLARSIFSALLFAPKLWISRFGDYVYWYVYW